MIRFEGFGLNLPTLGVVLVTALVITMIWLVVGPSFGHVPHTEVIR